MDFTKSQGKVAKNCLLLVTLFASVLVFLVAPSWPDMIWMGRSAANRREIVREFHSVWKVVTLKQT